MGLLAVVLAGAGAGFTAPGGTVRQRFGFGRRARARLRAQPNRFRAALHFETVDGAAGRVPLVLEKSAR